MKNQLLKVSLKYGLILGGFSLVGGLINTLLFNPYNLNLWSSALTGILFWILLLLLIPMAHYEYNKKTKALYPLKMLF